ncbi:unnamed protein product [Macrosiphum euphorbiae]|uniref:Uncharacterized protein n=1 Tax=Macrosiphum euphorbiae TaxID=13131 RepID=A0AAV0WA87_9HEMI|nr:unnamed protein product [Macrosiphum euphorbiae]
MLRRKRALKILAMIPPEDSGESCDEENIIQREESPLPSEAIEEDLDELLKELEQYPLHEFLEEIDNTVDGLQNNVFEQLEYIWFKCNTNKKI